MLKNIRTSIILVLAIINFFGFILFCITLSNYYGEPKTSKQSPFSIDYDRVKEQNVSIYDNNKKNQTLNSNNNINRNKIFKYKKNLNLRKLYDKYSFSYYSSFYKESLLILNLIFLYFCFNLILSFFVGENECKNCCCSDCHCGGSDCNCNNSSGGNGGEIIVCLILIIILILIYFLTKLCGKHLSRFISISSFIIINFLILIISFIYIAIDDDSAIKYNIAISSILFICNVLGISLPNFKKCENLTYKSSIAP